MANRKPVRRHSYTSRSGRTYYRGSGGFGVRQSGGKGHGSYSVQGTGPLLAVGAWKAAKWTLPKLFKGAAFVWDWLTTTEEPERPPRRQTPPLRRQAPASRPPVQWAAPSRPSGRPLGLCTVHGSSIRFGCLGCDRAAGR